MNPKRVLVTGSDGYIGSVLMPMLQRCQFEGIGVDIGWFAEGRFTRQSRRWTTLRRDIRDLEAKDLEGFDAVVHLAALCNDPLGDLDTNLTMDINYRATIKLAEISRAAGISRFVFSSSCSNYGKDVELVDEESRLHPQTTYAKSKVKAEQELLRLATDGFSPVILRNATVFGISPRQRFDLIVPNLAGNAFVTGKVELISDGTPWRPLVHVRDVCRTIIGTLVEPRASVHNQVFNVGSTSENYQVLQIAERVRQRFPDAELRFRDNAAADERSYQVNFDKLRIHMERWKPKRTLSYGISECLEAFPRVSLDERTLHDRRFNRLKQIRFLLNNGKLSEDLRWCN